MDPNLRFADLYFNYEEKIMALKEMKRQMGRQVVNVTDMDSIPISEEELKELILG